MSYREESATNVRYATRQVIILCSFDSVSLYNLVNKTNLGDNLFLVYLFLVYLLISTCFGRLCAHHQNKQLCSCDTWCLLFCVDDCLVCRVEWKSIHFTLHTRQSSTQNNKYQVSHEHSGLSRWWAYIRLKHVQINKYTKNMLCSYHQQMHFFITHIKC